MCSFGVFYFWEIWLFDFWAFLGSVLAFFVFIVVFFCKFVVTVFYCDLFYLCKFVVFCGRRSFVFVVRCRGFVLVAVLWSIQKIEDRSKTKGERRKKKEGRRKKEEEKR